MIAPALGTVQLGVPYGNKSNQPLMSAAEAGEILGFAAANAVAFFDTAAGYGESEARIGAFLRTGRYPVQVSTKIPPVSREQWSDRAAYRKFVTATLAESRRRLGVEAFDLLQFHQCDLDFIQSPAVHAVFHELLEAQVCRRLGISVYETEQAVACLDVPALSAVQIPVNLIDRRFVTPALLREYEQRSFTVIARSVFWQGSLVEGAPVPVVKKAPLLGELKAMILKCLGNEVAMPMEHVALRYVFGNLKNHITYGLLGTDSIGTLKANLAFIAKDSSELPAMLLAKLAPVAAFAEENDLLNPANWNK